jgi:hypothetical protein
MEAGDPVRRFDSSPFHATEAATKGINVGKNSADKFNPDSSDKTYRDSQRRDARLQEIKKDSPHAFEAAARSLKLDRPPRSK